jgi:hypothetical protein
LSPSARIRGFINRLLATLSQNRVRRTSGWGRAWTTITPTADVLETRVLLSSTLLGQPVFPADNPWNQDISNAPIAANSAAIISHIGSTIPVHPDWGADNPANGTQPLYGIPYNVVHGNSTAKINVIIDNYATESDVVPVPIPNQAVLEGDYQNGPNLNGGGYLANQRGDSHLIVFDVDNDVVYELYGVTRPADPTLFPNNSGVELAHSDGLWHAAQESVWNMKTNTFRTLGETSADAAGLSILAGLARPDEGLPVSQGGTGAITHALRLTLPKSDVNSQYIYPASHQVFATAGASNLPLGSRLRLANTAAVNALINNMPPESQVIARAMQKYGLILADIGSAMYVTGTSASMDSNNQINLTWNMNDVLASNGLRALTAGDFEVVDLRPVVTGLSVQAGAAGDTVTISGQNFSGAAGHLSVFFGSNPAASVSVLSDTQLTAVAPAGTGTVDVTVQSGQNETDAISSSPAANVNAPIFGYGVSAVTAGDQFTYSSTANDLTDRTTAATLNSVEGNSTGAVALATFTDGDPNAAATDFQASVDWSGAVIGTPSVSVAFVSKDGITSKWKIMGSAVYAEKGAFTATVNITDADGSKLTSTKTTFKVADAPLTDTTPPATVQAVEGNSTGLVTLATFTDGDPAARAADFKPSVVWNGGVIGTPSVSVAFVSTDGVTSKWKVLGSAVYAEPGTYIPTVKITDLDGSIVQMRKTSVSVVEAALNDATAAATLPATEGKTTGTVVLATFSDANPFAPSTDFTASVNWNGTLIGTPTASVVLVSRTAAASLWKVTGRAVYAEPGLYHVGVTVHDRDGGTAAASKVSIDVVDAALSDTTVSATVGATRLVQSSNVVLATFTDGNPNADISDFNVTVDWGGATSGTPNWSVVLVSRTSTASNWEVLGNVTYNAAGTFTVTVSISDVDGATLTSKRTKFLVSG